MPTVLYLYFIHFKFLIATKSFSVRTVTQVLGFEEQSLRFGLTLALLVEPVIFLQGLVH